MGERDHIRQVESWLGRPLTPMELTPVASVEKLSSEQVAVMRYLAERSRLNTLLYLRLVVPDAVTGTLVSFIEAVREDALVVALAELKRSSITMEAFLSEYAPQYAGYGLNIGRLAGDLLERLVSSVDIRALRDSVYEPFRGTFGSMHDLSFLGAREDEYQELKRRLGRALDDVESAFRDRGVD